MGPDRRGSRPITTWSPLSTRAAARPSTRASSGVSSALATPRTPSVPKRRAMWGPGCSALGVLRRLAGLLEAGLLALLLARVTGQQTRPLEGRPHLRIDLDQGPGDAKAERAGLAADAPTVKGGIH